MKRGRETEGKREKIHSLLFTVDCEIELFSELILFCLIAILNNFSILSYGTH